MAYEYKEYEYVESNLVKAGEVLKKVQIVLAVITGICGIIVAACEKDIHGDFSFLLFLTALIPYAVATAILIGLAWLDSILFSAFADVHFYLRSLNRAAHISNKEQSGTSAMMEKTENVREAFDKSQPSMYDHNHDTWKCPKCGRTLKNYQTTCNCGQKQSAENTQQNNSSSSIRW